MPILQQPLISMFTRTWNRRKSASPRCSSLLENREVQMKAEYREVISLLRKGYSIRDVAKLSGKGGKYRTTSEAITKSTITAIILLILRSFQRKGLCNSGLKAKSTTFVRNITTIRLRSQFVILKMNINMTDKIGKKEATFAVPYNGEDNNDYVDGKGFCCNDGSLEAAQARVMARAMKNNFQEGDTYEKMQFYYHPDHLGSSSYITNLDGEVVQHIEYVPFGEVFVEERNDIWNTPYLFNAKEFDEETGLYYYGARYYDPRLSLWLSIDPKEEKYSNVSTYCYVISNPLKYTDPTGMEIDMTKVRLADEQLKLSTTQSVIKDLASQTGLQLSLDKDNKLQYAKNDEGKPIVNKITNKKGKEIDAGSKTARNFLTKMIDNKTEIEVSYHAKRTVTSGTQIGISFEQISNMVKGAVGVDGNTLGFGMTFLHELHHTTIGGDYHDSTELFGTGPVVDNMNIIRNELNKQGFNYGERLNYKAIHTKEGNIIPFNESALTSLKYNSSMGKKAHYIKTK